MGNRIVVNLEAPPQNVPTARAAQGRRRRWPRVLAILGVVILVVVVVVAVAGFVSWRYYQSTPTYTLALMIDAAQRNDVAEFEKRIDHESIAKNMAAAVSQKAAGRYGLALDSSIQQRIDGAMPALLPRLKQTIHQEVAKELKAIATTSEPQPFIRLLVAIPSLMTITTEGDAAKATANINGRTIELAMQRDAERWKVTEFKDDVVVQRVVDSVMKDLPAIRTSDALPFLKSPARNKRSRRNR
ncbi:MAG TPA: hypothetical protein VFR78_08745 [Pyrinomonadaceae bacterium]|nr:hypothetical protein [Pyrinomonadaceae bacterium]